MQNPMLKGLNQSQLTNNIAPLKNTIQMLKMAKNPNAMIPQIMANNPNMKQAMDYVNANGGNAKEAFNKLAKENGLNTEEILKQIM